MIECDRCHGSGETSDLNAEGEYRLRACPDCDGEGQFEEGS